MTLEELRTKNIERITERVFGHDLDDWEITDWACALAGEAGEVCNVVKKIRRDGWTQRRHEQLADELADVLIYLDALAAYDGIDLAAATKKKFNEVSEKRKSKVFFD